MRDWLVGHWVAGAGFMAAALLAVVPALTLPPVVLLIFLHSPGYMIHQVEEHAGDRFRRFANTVVFDGREGLTRTAVLVVNLPVVWGLNLAAFYAALAYGLGYGLVAPYAMLVNALTHVAVGVRLRRYNPGLATSLVLFLPLSLATLFAVIATGAASLPAHLCSLAGALVLHLAIIAQVQFRLRRLPA
ncbi:HXXEE domain-containing protein [Ancylobacter sp. MQZ15Z-1]|uniref:HXXEE domain-containing protein n=1 Tax=Ancylobacter mangrovi TaxID=2972472 RepID=A0A9X2PJD8_9HYPH|nr:HXXEE domain-containing protein [Ancylobacter mangrovi]MCS0496247.1 HXXEE domain-containing protein [Ancylobacter mangrovi]